MARTFDIVVFGATGFTGGLVARYLAGLAAPVRWAIAGRSLDRLRAVKEAIETERGAPIDVELAVANSNDDASMASLAASTTVVLSTVGPFTLYGEPLVRACVQSGTHYVDSTGETPWVRRMIDRYHDQARAAAVRVVPMCGFDSIPADLGTHMMLDHLHRSGRQADYVKAAVSMAGGASGGTLSSILTLLEDGKSAKDMRDPFLLNPDRRPLAPPTARSADIMLPAWDGDHAAWTYPFVMAGANTRVVRRSHALLHDAGEPLTGDSFEYNEAARTSSRVVAYVASLLMLVALVALQLGFVRSLVRRFGPKPGTGPSKATREKAWFRYQLAAKVSGGNEVVHGEVAGKDPGYDETAKMLAETALCLAFDHDKLPSGHTGVVTPAFGLGMPLVERLRSAGIKFHVDE